MSVERIVLRKPDLHFFYAAEEAKAGKSSSGSGTITKATWAEGLRQVLGLDLPWLSLQPMLVALEAGSGRVEPGLFRRGGGGCDLELQANLNWKR